MKIKNGFFLYKEPVKNSFIQAAEILVPWCCIEAFRGVFHALEFIR